MLRNRFNLKRVVDSVSYCQKNGFLISVIKHFLPPCSSLAHEIMPQMDSRFETQQILFLEGECGSLSVAMWWSDEAWLNIYIYHSLLSERMWQGFSKVSPKRDKMEKFVRDGSDLTQNNDMRKLKRETTRSVDVSWISLRESNLQPKVVRLIIGFKIVLLIVPFIRLQMTHFYVKKIFT